jgi:GGDEF domain-containing protein
MEAIQERSGMPDPAERIRHTLIERIRQIIDQHHASGHGDDAQVTCSCGAQRLSDYPRHLAEQIIDRLGLKAEATDHVTNQIRYATAWFDWELTKLEGAQS